MFKPHWGVDFIVEKYIDGRGADGGDRLCSGAIDHVGTATPTVPAPVIRSRCSRQSPENHLDSSKHSLQC